MEFQKSHRQRLAAANEKKVMPFALIILPYLFFVSYKTVNRNYQHVRCYNLSTCQFFSFPAPQMGLFLWISIYNGNHEDCVESNSVCNRASD